MAPSPLGPSPLPYRLAHRRPTTSWLIVVFVALVTLGSRSSARADSPLEGKWTQGPMKEDYTVLKWQKECEAPPVNGSSGGGESISIHAEGDELSFVGGGRVFKTNQCYDPMPTLLRETHTRSPSGREWRTRCATPPNDPRHAVMNTLVVATSDTHIDIIETGRYESQITGGLCTADVKRSRSFDLVARDTPLVTAPTAAPSAAPAPKPESPPAENPCASPGDPVRLEVRPSRKLMKIGDTYAFRALVLDASGCPTRTGTTWTVDDHGGASRALRVDPSGKVTVAPDAPEGSFDLTVTAQGTGKSTHVTVDVTSASRYDALLAQSGLNDAGENDVASVVAIAAAQIGGSDAVAEDGSKTRRAIFLTIVALLAAALGAVAVVATRRTKRAAALEREAQEKYAEKVEALEARKRAKTKEHADALRAHEESVERAKQAEQEDAAPSRMVCPACRREYEAGSAFCPNDANRLVPLNTGEAAPGLIAPGAPSGSICPTCKRGYDPGVKVCPKDKDELIPYALYASRQPASPVAAARGKICPTCGGRFDGRVEFCGKDGTALVLLN